MTQNNDNDRDPFELRPVPWWEYALIIVGCMAVWGLIAYAVVWGMRGR